MSRCKSCDVILTANELSRTKEDGTPEDLCGGCGYLVFLDVEDLYTTHDYAFAELTEGIGGQVYFEQQVKVGMSEYS